VDADTSEYPLICINYDRTPITLGTIQLRTCTPVKPNKDYFILSIGDSLFYGANQSYHGCFNNELSRLFNGTGRQIANGRESIGFDNVHVIGTMGADENLPVLYEGRGGWTVGMYLTNASSPFVNPSTHSFDMNYYLQTNNFFT